MKRSLLAGIGLCALAMAVQPAAAADLPTKAPAYMAPVAAPLFNWSGFYVGGTVGYGWGRSEHFASEVPGSTTGKFDIDGFVGGGTLGWNWQAPGSPLVLGLEADISYASIDGSTGGNISYGCGAQNSCETSVEWFGTVRGRLGIAHGNLLPFISGGYAYGKVKAGAPNGLSGSDTLNGWTAGAGVEWAYAPNWSAKLEYLYVDLGDFDYAFTFVPLESKANFHVVRVGLNYRFASGKAPVASPAVMTKY